MNRNIIAVIAGTVSGFLVGAPVIYIILMTVAGSKDIGAVALFTFVGLFIPAFAAGFVCGYIAKNN